VIGNADTDTITQGAAYVTGTQLRSAKVATNTLALAAYDVDGVAYTNLVTLTASNTPTLALTSTGVGTINNMSIGATTASTGAFTTLSATGVTTVQAGTALLPAITTTGDTNTGIYFPAADTIGFTEGGVEALRLNSNGQTSTGIAGTALLPSFTRTGDENTGIFFPAADTIAFAEGGVEAMRLDSSGNLGIGTASPTSYQAGSRVVQINSATANTEIKLTNTTSGTAATDGLMVAQWGNDAYLWNGETGGILFGTSNQEQMRLTSTGLGIGTSSPAYKVDVRNGTLAVGNGTIFGGVSYSTRVEMGAISNHDLGFITNNTTRMVLDSSGNLGLGVTPSAWGSNGNLQMTKLSFAPNDYSLGSNYYQSDTYRYATNDTAARLSFFNGGFAFLTAPSGTAGNAISFTQAMTLTAGGNLLVGTTTDAGRLTVSGTIRTLAGDIELDSGQITTNSSANPLRLGVDGTERARIDSSGNLLVGNTSKLSGGIGGIDINRSSGAGLTLGTSGTSRGFFYVNSADNSILWETVSGVSALVVSGSSGGVSLANGATSWASLSDERHKDIIEPISNATDKVALLRSVIGKYKTDEAGTRRSFLIAQDVQAVLPEAVDNTDTENLALRYSDLIPLLVKAIQEQQALIQALTARVAALESN
jgi:hypothetical protein